MKTNGDVLKRLLKDVGVNPFQIEEEEQLVTIIEDLYNNMDQLVKLIFNEKDLDGATYKQHHKKLLRALSNGLFDNLESTQPKGLKDPNITDLEHLEESKKPTTSEDDFLGKIATITKQFIQFPDDENTVHITLKKQNGLMQVSAFSDEISHHALKPVFAVDPHASKKTKSKFEAVLSNINNLIRS